jgi:hypothetical protein
LFAAGIETADTLLEWFENDIWRLCVVLWRYISAWMDTTMERKQSTQRGKHKDRVKVASPKGGLMLRNIRPCFYARNWKPTPRSLLWRYIIQILVPPGRMNQTLRPVDMIDDAPWLDDWFIRSFGPVG